MNDHSDHLDPALDRTVDAIRAERLDDATTAAATERVWHAISAATAPLAACADYQALIPDFVAGTLAEARALLVKDHTGECVACRRVLLAARSHGAAAAGRPAARTRRQLPQWLKLAAAAVVVGATTVAGYGVVGDQLASRRLQAAVSAVDGQLQRIGADGGAVAPGAVLHAGQAVRTERGSGAVLTLADGSTVELDERAELSLAASRRGTTIHLDRGNIIVHAAKQKGGRLYVATDDCTVAVKGTVFAVTTGLKGSRVSVVEGEVEVDHGASRALLHPGDQVTTSDRLEQVPVAAEIAWSRNAEAHLALLEELTSLQREVAAAVDVADARSSTRLLDLAPADTLVYGAMPNLTEGVVKARAVFASRLAASPTLAAWWQEKMVATGVESELEGMLDRLEPLGAAVGDELVVAVPRTAISEQGAPVLLATLADPASFTALLAAEVDRLNAEAGADLVLEIVADPGQATAQDGHVYLWVSGDIFAASPSLATLQILAGDLATGSSGFVGTPLHQRLGEAYQRGVEWLLGMDTGELLASAASADTDPSDLALLEQLGLLDATTLVVERSSDGDVATTQAQLDFSGPRRGLAAWLAAPAPMGSLDFVSPNAIMAGAVVARDAADMFDEVMSAVLTVNPDAGQELAALEARLGFDLRDDLVATLGGEAAFAVDGPLLPTPSWKLIVEVYDPATLQHTVEQMVVQANQAFADEGQATRLELSTETVNGHVYFGLGQAGRSPLAHYSVVDGFLVVAPTTAVIEQALQYRASGLTLTSSALFASLLPSNGYVDCSALSYRNLGAVSELLPAGAVGSLPPEVLALVEQSAVPSLYCVYGEADRIIVSGTGGSLLGMAPLLSLPTLLDDAGGEHDANGSAAEVSS